MKRKIITIEESKCDGCGACVPGCPEGALRIIDGKARLVSDLFCDGLGACIGNCPKGAITIEEREAEPYDERKVMDRIVTQGENTIIAHLKHLKDHGEDGLYKIAADFLAEKGITVGVEKKAPEHGHGGCPGSAARHFSAVRKGEASSGASALETWPVQLRLVNPNAPYFDDADLLVSADCAAFAYGNFHDRFLKGKVPVIFCPKLDQDVESYIEKMARILSSHTIRSITVVRMVVPCCGGTSYVVKEALARAGKDIPVTDVVISLEGNIL